MYYVAKITELCLSRNIKVRIIKYRRTVIDYMWNHFQQVN